MSQIELTEAQEQLAQLVLAAQNGEEIVITQNNQPIAKIVAIPLPKKRIEPGSAQGLIWMADDFDAPLEDFKEYM